MFTNAWNHHFIFLFFGPCFHGTPCSLSIALHSSAHGVNLYSNCIEIRGWTQSKQHLYKDSTEIQHSDKCCLCESSNVLLLLRLCLSTRYIVQSSCCFYCVHSLQMRTGGSILLKACGLFHHYYIIMLVFPLFLFLYISIFCNNICTFTNYTNDEGLRS